MNDLVDDSALLLKAAARIRALEDETEHQRGHVNALRDQMQKAQEQRDEAYARIRALESEPTDADRMNQLRVNAIRERDEARARIRALETGLREIIEDAKELGEEFSWYAMAARDLLEPKP